MLRSLVPLHRWLGVAFCLPVAMWFASGVVMHFVPSPAAVTEAERLAGSDEIDLARLEHGPAEAIAVGGNPSPSRVRLVQRADGPVYLISGSSDLRAIRANDLTDGRVSSEQSALSIAAAYARGRHRDTSHAALLGMEAHDQWTMSGAYDAHRPLYRIALNDGPATDIYVSSTTGEVVLETTRYVRAWNYLGSVVHWIYFTGLRSEPAAWSLLLWALSFLALITAALGAIIGPLRLTIEGRRLVSPFRGWQAWHHWLGLVFMPFIITWLFSGWLSMDDGLLFSSGKLAPAETRALIGEGPWGAVSADEIRRLQPPLREMVWFAFGGNIYRKEVRTIEQREPPESLPADAIDAAARRLQRSCEPAFPVGGGDSYATASAVAQRSVFRVVCGADWFDVDAADGTVTKIDASRRSYRWLYQALHRLDWPFVTHHPTLRTVLIVAMSIGGLAFSFTAVVIGCRRVSLTLTGREEGGPTDNGGSPRFGDERGTNVTSADNFPAHQGLPAREVDF
jgi:PepSY-associated TM region